MKISTVKALNTEENEMGATQKKITEYVSKKPEMVPIPSRLEAQTLARAQASAKKLDVSLRDFIEGAIKMACDQVGK